MRSTRLEQLNLGIKELLRRNPSRLNLLVISRTVSTFSCDIAYSRSPRLRGPRLRSSNHSTADDLPVAEREHGPVVVVHLDPARPAARLPPHPHRPPRLARSLTSVASIRTVSHGSSAREQKLPDRVEARISFSGQSPTGTASTSASQSADQPALSRRAKASSDALTISTFSCDIAYSESPAASRASRTSALPKPSTSARTTLPSRIVHEMRDRSSIRASPSGIRRERRPKATISSPRS